MFASAKCYLFFNENTRIPAVNMEKEMTQKATDKCPHPYALSFVFSQYLLSRFKSLFASGMDY